LGGESTTTHDVRKGNGRQEEEEKREAGLVRNLTCQVLSLSKAFTLSYSIIIIIIIVPENKRLKVQQVNKRLLQRQE